MLDPVGCARGRSRSISVGFAQPVTDARFRRDVLRLVGAQFDLLSKLSDIDAEILNIGGTAQTAPRDVCQSSHIVIVA